MMNEAKQAMDALLADGLARTTISLSDLAEALAKLDVYKPGLSYDETAEAIMNAQVSR
jgi:hypothetical protein